MISALWMVFFLGVLATLVYQRRSLATVTLSCCAALFVSSAFAPFSAELLCFFWLITLVTAVVLNSSLLRQKLLTTPLLAVFKKNMPLMSTTEKVALLAGDISWEAELFNGKPNWQQFAAISLQPLSQEEQDFLNGPVQTVCNMADDWQISHQDLDLSTEIWQYLKEQGFFALIIPKKYGGKGFSASAHSEIIAKLVSASVTLSSTVSVPNSLGPAELLLHYGTEQQKNYYLPRLAQGLEIPCFALTHAEAGSDAGSIPDSGVICKAYFQGKETLGIRLNFEKRYITLAPVATVIGLAFKLFDPEKLLSAQVERGITCALLPADTEGVLKGRRHYPLHTPLQNGPISGKDVFIPIEWVIGGQQMIGRGWPMLMECLSVGRAISLPAAAAGGSRACAYACGAYARIRKQFNCSLSQFEGIQEVLARITGIAYLADAARSMTTSVIDTGIKPTVASAIVKYHLTELSQQLSKDAMDLHAGKAICMGPKNYIARGYEAAPIAITVEGANILTRSMILYGQGSLRCHPYLLQEMHAAAMSDKQDSLALFDKTLFAHFGFVLSNALRTWVTGLLRGRGSATAATAVEFRRHQQSINRYSAALAFVSDVSLFLLGGQLKRREKISARLGDVLSYLYLASAVLKRADHENIAAEKALLDWCMQFCFYRCQQALLALLNNYPHKWVARILRLLVFPSGAYETGGSDVLDQQVARLISTDSACRQRFAQHVGAAANPQHPIYELERALQAVIAAEPLQDKLQQAEKQGLLARASLDKQVVAAVAIALISEEEAETILQAVALKRAVIAVDDFSEEELHNRPRQQDNHTTVTKRSESLMATVL